MTDSITKQYADKLLYTLLIRNHITHSDVDYYVQWHRDEIDGMIRIFDHENDKDQRLTLELLGILAGDQREKVIGFYSKTYNLPPIQLDFPKEDIKLLLTACWDDPAFFYFALSVCEDIKLKLNQLEPDTGKEEPLIISFPTKGRVIVDTEKAALKPAADNTKLVSFFVKSLDCEGIHGKLVFYSINQLDVILEFIFDKPQKNLPYKLQVHITTQCDGTKHPPITIPGEGKNIKDGEIASITSKPTSGINYSGGFDYSVTAILQDTP
jgi:hypothetical protein